MPKTSATASAMAALARLARPGSVRDNSVTCPTESMMLSPSSTHRAGGRAKSHSPQHQPRSSLLRSEPHLGQHHESSCHRWPAATQVTCGASLAAQAINGSSALATTRQSGAAARALRQRRASSQISAARSIWSRLRFSSATTRALVASRTAGRYASSTSSTANGASGAWPSAAASPASILAPNAFEATSWPSAPSAEVISRVVVVLPFVPVTSTTWRSAASRASSSGSTRKPMTPPITDPSPRPARRDILPPEPPIVAARPATGTSCPPGRLWSSRAARGSEACPWATMLSARGVMLAFVRAGRPLLVICDEPARPGQHHFEPRRDAHGSPGLAHLCARTDTDERAGQVVGEGTLVVVAQQDAPCGRPVARERHGQRVAAQCPEPVPDPHVRPVRDAGQVKVEGRGPVQGVGRPAAERAHPLDLMQPADLRDDPARARPGTGPRPMLQHAKRDRGDARRQPLRVVGGPYRQGTIPGHPVDHRGQQALTQAPIEPSPPALQPRGNNGKTTVRQEGQDQRLRPDP